MTDATGRPIGIIGLGRIGGAIARRLIASGATVVGHDIDDGRNARLLGRRRPTRTIGRSSRQAG